MIGRQEWFKRRKYGGWGLFPATWQGWVYIAVAIGILFVFQLLPLNDNARLVGTITWAVILAIDTIDIMIRMKRDERETKHEAIAERNALWAVMIVLCVGIAYQAASSTVIGKFTVDPIIIIALVAALIVKAISNIYLDRRD